MPPVTILGYEERTGELTYRGDWSGDLTVRLKQIVGGTESQAFRIRVLTPTMVYGQQAIAINQQHAWNAKRVCPSETISFANCRAKATGGLSDIAPLVVFVTPGTYRGQDWYLSTRRFTYILGDPTTRPTLFGDAVSGSKKEMFYIANLNMNDVSITHSGPLAGAPNTMIVRSVYQCCETSDQNGIVNPNTVTNTYPWSVYWHASESKGMGGVGNTTHPAYVEGRPMTVFDVNNLRVLGSRGSSGLKTVMAEFNVRHSLLQVAETLDEIADGVCIHPGRSTGCLMHTPVDFPGYTAATIYANKFIVWRGKTGAGIPAGRSGVLAGTIFIRQRGPSFGSDTPNYPNKSWNPPVSSQPARLQGFCKDWSPLASSFVADEFWKDVRARAARRSRQPVHVQALHQLQPVRAGARFAARVRAARRRHVSGDRRGAVLALRADPAQSPALGGTLDEFFIRQHVRGLWRQRKKNTGSTTSRMCVWSSRSRSGRDKAPMIFRA